MILTENFLEGARPHAYGKRQAGAVGIAQAAARCARRTADGTTEKILAHRQRSYGQLAAGGGMMLTMDESDIEALYDQLIAAWNDHEGEAMAEPFAEDGVIIGFDGSVSSGRQAIGTEMSNIFADHETGRYAVKVQSVRALGPQAVILRAIAGLVPPGQRAINAETNSHQTVVAQAQDGQWRIVLFQNTPAQFHGRPELVEDMTRELQAVADS
jgi:uncharacterized protein (TIGR02246 family)